MLAARTIRSLLPALVLALLCLPALAQGPADQAARLDDALGRTGDDYQQLKLLIESAPARQIGQPGNELVDELVKRRLAAAVAAANAGESARWKQAQEALAKARAAQDHFDQQEDAQFIPVRGQAEVESPFYLRLTVENPTFPVIVLTGAGLLSLLMYALERRRRALWFGVVALLLAASLPMAAGLIETPSEVARRGRSEGGQGIDLNADALAVYQADVEAARQLQGLWQCGRVTYPIAAFVPGAATLEVEGRSVPAYQMSPNLVEPANLPGLAFSGRAVYVGRGRPVEMATADLRGAAAVLEFDSGKAWLEAVQLGAQIVIVLEPADDKAVSFTEAALKISNSPLSIPRFYLKRADLVAAFGADWQAKLAAGAKIDLKQKSPGKWINQEAAADWLFIPAAAGSRGANELVHIQTYKDSASVVPALSPGASSGANVLLGLRLIEHFARNPPARPVLMTFINGHAASLQGEQEFDFAAFCDPNAALQELTWLDREAERQQFIRDLHDLKGGPIDAGLIAYLRDEAPSVAGQVLKANKTILEELRSEQTIIHERRRTLALSLNADTPPDAPIRAEIKRLDDQTVMFMRFMQLFNRFGHKTGLRELSAEELEQLRGVFHRIADDAAVRLESASTARRRLLDNLALRRRLVLLTDPAAAAYNPATPSADNLFLRRHAALKSTAVLGLDLSFDGDRLGFFTHGYLRSKQFIEEWALVRSAVLAETANKAADEYCAGARQPNLLADTLLNSALPWQSYMGTHLAMGTWPVQDMDRVSLTLATVHDARLRAFTPCDTAERIDPARFDTLMSFARGYLPVLVDAAHLSATPQSVGQVWPVNVELDIRQQDQFSVSVPQAPVPGALVVGWGDLGDSAVTPMLGEVRGCPIVMADARGSAVVRGYGWRGCTFSAFKYDDDFSRITATLDRGEGETRFPSIILPGKAEPFVSRILVAFSADKVDLLGLTEPLTLNPISRVDVIDGFRAGLPQHFGFAGVAAVAPPALLVPTARDGSGSVFIEPGRSFKLRTGAGLLINADEREPAGVGFRSDAGLIRDTVTRSAADMWYRTDDRLRTLLDKGVLDDTATQFNKEARSRLDAAAAAEAAHRNGERLVDAEVARGLAFRSYIRAYTTVNDLVKAAIIFLALVIPFCFFITKLTSPYTDINRQLGFFVAVFAVVALLLWLVHPAFKIAATPSVVILAFVIMGLAVFVATIVMGRFNASMNRAIEESQGAESSDAPQGRLAGVAFMVGVNNMKRRRIRTTLTTLTIILVTFTMLSVISIGQDVEPARVHLGRETPYTGLLLTRPGLSVISPTQLARLRAHFAGRAQTVARIWAQQQGRYNDYMPFAVLPAEGGADAFEAKVVLGLEKGEDGFAGKMPLAGGRWFSSNEAREIVLSVKAAGLLGIGPDNFKGKTLLLNGLPLELVGLLDDGGIEKMHDLDDLPILPMLSAPSQSAADQNTTARDDPAAAGAALEGGGNLTATPGIEPARAIDVACVPLGIARNLPGADFRTLSAKFTDADASAKAWEAARDFIRFQHTRLFVGVGSPFTPADAARPIEPGQYSLTSSTSTQVGGILKVAIPIILAATIILNTMLGSVMERRREVGIYNAIGLNPGHVMVFFLAESLVFGMIGSVAGYLIGQGLSIAITKSGLIDLNLNYSSLSVMVVIFLTIATVLLSTLYPAMMAARAAVPSGQRRWSLPKPQGDQIFVQFPFCYDASRVRGVCAFLRDFMQQNSEASTGQFLARLGPVGLVPNSEGPSGGPVSGGGGANYAMLFDVAPAPFDLGVNQTMEVYAYFDPHVRAHMIAVHLTRVSGETSNWKTVNQPFLESLRKRLLNWRSQRPETHQVYHRQGEALFSEAKELPLTAGAVDAAVGGR